MPTRAAHRGIHQLRVRHIGRHQHIAQPLAGQGQGFAEGVAHQRVLIIGGHPGQGRAGEIQLPVGLVRNQPDGVAHLGGLLPQQLTQPGHGLPGAHRPGGIVGGVNDNRLGPLVQRGLKRFKINLEGLGLRRHHHHLSPRPFNEHLIFREIRGDDHNPVPRAGQGVKAAAQSRGRAHRDVKVVAGIFGPKPAV
ncbi:hypothetical protein SDC9_83731 [bioreactor metagenome]|uniref:Uncharacterized protein n=1 Tax=bioreactor metagenome TaxID=1076179 RepID=A0A644Z8B2_9ZZZZ